MQLSRGEVISSLITDDPDVQKLLVEAEARGMAEGEIKARKGNLFTVLTIRFSATLAVQAQSVITPIQNADTLKLLFQQMLRVPDEQTARIVLGLPSE